MFKSLKKEFGLNKTTFLNMLSITILQGIAFLSIPIFTRVLGTEQYGMYSIFNSWVIILSTVISLSIGNCIASGKYFYKDEYYNFRNNIILLNTITCIIILIILLLLYSRISILISYSFHMYIILLLTAFSSNTINIITSVLIYEKKALLNFVLSIFLAIANILLSLFLILNFSFNNIFEGRVYGHFIPYFLTSVFLVIYILLTKSFKFNFKYVKYGISVGIPVLFHQLSHFILGQSDRVMMEKMNINISDIGIYSLFYSFCGALTIILGAFNTSFAPFYYDYIDKDDKNSIIYKSKNYIELFTIISIGFLLLSREVTYFMASEEYYSGINLIPIFVGSTYFIFMYQFAVNYEFFYRKTKTISFGSISAAIINVVLNLYFINRFGMYGAAYATIISYFLLYIFHYFIAKSIKEKRFYLSFKYYILGIGLILLFSYLFYALYDRIILRWCIGAILGIFELYRIYKRKSIF